MKCPRCGEVSTVEKPEQVPVDTDRLLRAVSLLRFCLTLKAKPSLSVKRRIAEFLEGGEK